MLSGKGRLSNLLDAWCGDSVGDMEKVGEPARMKEGGGRAAEAAAAALSRISREVEEEEES